MRAADLLPPPQQLQLEGPGLQLPSHPRLVLASDPSKLLRCALEIQQALGDIAGVRAEIVAGGEGAITLAQDSTDLSRGESYRLVVHPGGVNITGADPAGVFYGGCTLVQLVRLHGRRLPGLRIEDWPDFRHRGVLLDVSRDRVPTMEMLLQWVDLLASWKVNQLQLYMEHTFAYRGHEAVWADASPLSGEQILLLDAHCSERHVELVPNQNSFGHMHRWLIHEPYRRLAECPDGIDHPFSPDREPYGLCPTDPDSLSFLAGLYDQLLPQFQSGQINVGLDETFDLGLGRSAARCREIGTERVYLEFLHEVHRMVGRRGRRMQFWGDIILKRPDLIGELPRDAIALEWGYEADHPFEVHTRHFADANLEFYVCPGTSSWNSIAGRTDNALGNLAHAAVCGHAAGASGLLVTDWGDNGHLQPPPVSLPGFAAGAAFAWNRSVAGEPGQLDLAALLDRHAFLDSAGVMGRLALDLGNTYLATGVTLKNGTILSRLLLTPQAWPTARIPGTLGAEGMQRALEHLEQASAALDRASIGRTDAELVRAEYRWVADALELACRIGLARLDVGLDHPLEAVPEPVRLALSEAMRRLVDGHQTLWLRRSRPGGLADSAARLERTLRALQG